MPSEEKLSQGDNCATSKAHTNHKNICEGWNGLTRASHTNARRSVTTTLLWWLIASSNGWSFEHSSSRIVNELLEKNCHGCHVGVLTKNGAKFCNILMNIINNQMHVKVIITSPYHPQCNVLANCFNLTTSTKLAKKSSIQFWLGLFWLA